jgi:Arc/MetJ-type ribon-helix-helix transcriptional regulator
MLHVNVKLDDDMAEMLERYMDRHGLENRSQSIRHALRSILNLEEGETVALKPARKVVKGPASVNSRARKRVATPEKETAHDRLEAQKIIDRVTSARKAPAPRDPDCPVSDEAEAEYFARITKENKLKAQGVGPEPWPE